MSSIKENAHTSADLVQLQSLPLEDKIDLTKDRIRAWHDAWMRFEIYNRRTKKTRFAAVDVRDNPLAEPKLTTHEEIVSAVRGGIYLSFSGGKDSTVLKHIVDSMYDDVPAVFSNTGLEYPEIQRFVFSQPHVEVIRPAMRFDQIVMTYGYPLVSKRVAEYVYTAKRDPNSKRAKWIRGEESTKFVQGGKWTLLVDAPFMVSGYCCEEMKKKPMHKYSKNQGRMPMTGQLAEESFSRRTEWMHYGCNGFDMKEPISNPLAFWTEQDILRYLKEYQVPYCSVYGEIVEKEDGLLATTGCDRTGCIFCGFGCHLEKEPNRFQRLKNTHPKQYEYCIGGGEWQDGLWYPSKEGLGLGYVLDYIGVPH